MIFDPPPRKRAIARYFWLVLVVVAVIVALVVSASGEQRRAELDYLEDIRSQAVELARDGDALRDVVSRLSRIDRSEFVTVIDGLREDLAVGLEFVAEEPPAESLLAIRSLYRTALETWDAGALGFASSVLTSADDPQSTVVVDSMADGLAELRAGDRLYADLATETERADSPNPVAALPRVLLMPSSGSLVSLSVSYVDSARSPNSGLPLRPGLAVSQIVAFPEWQVDQSGQAVSPATEVIRFSIVITNVGNVVSRTDTLVLTLTGGPEPVVQEAEVAPLEPNQQVTVEFETFEVDLGGVYEIEAKLAIAAEDSNLTDNDIRVQFSVNES